MTERGDSPTDLLSGDTERRADGVRGPVLSDGGVATSEAEAATGCRTGADRSDGAERDGEDQVTVLHVDDDPEVGLLVSEFLERSDHDLTVLTETDAAAALERVGAGDVDCVVTDVDMPGMSGLDLVRAMANRHPGLPVVLFTSHSWRTVGEESVATSVDDFVRKDGGHGQFEAVADAVVGTLD